MFIEDGTKAYATNVGFWDGAGEVRLALKA